MRKFQLVLLSSIVCLFLSCGNKQKEDKYASMPQELAEIYKKINKNPNDPLLYVELSRYYTNTGRLDSALNNALIAVRLDPNNSDIYVAAADVYFALEYLDVAEEILEKAIVVNAKNNEAYVNLGLLYLSRNKHAQTREILAKAIQLQTHNPQAYYLLAWNYRIEGDTLSAIRNYLIAAEQNSDYFDAYRELGSLYHCKGDPMAIDYYNNALNAKPNDAQSAEILYKMAMFYQEAGNYEKALERYRMILQIDPHHRNALHNMGWVYLMGEKKYDEAVVFFTKAIQLDTNYIEAVFNRGLSFENLKQYDNARQDYMYSLRLVNNYPLAIEGLNRLDKLQKR